MKKISIIEKILRAIFGHTKEKSATEFIVVEAYAGTKELTDVLADLIYSAYRRQTAAKSS